MQKQEAGSVDFWIKVSTAEKYHDLGRPIIGEPSHILWFFSSPQHMMSKNRNTLNYARTLNCNLTRISSFKAKTLMTLFRISMCPYKIHLSKIGSNRCIVQNEVAINRSELLYLSN